MRFPSIFTEEPRDVLILAAHQDDCVVMAGEYAIEAAAAGRRVQILYLTNGDSKDASPQSERACRRNAEAVAAWGSIRVGPDSIHFLGYPAAPVDGPSRITEANLDRIRQHLVRLLQTLPNECAVFIPAAGESHLDHRTLRQVALESLKLAGRDDLLVYEAPEYNPYLSLVRMPRKTLMYVLAAIPVVRRWAVMPGRAAAPEEFASGGRALVMPESAARLERKRRMLELFSSEDGQKLVRTFGGRGRFRRRTDFDSALRERPRGYLPIEKYQVGISTLIALAMIYGAAFVAMAMLGRLAVRVGVPKGTVAAAGAVLVAFAAWFCVVKAQDPRRRGFLVASVAGFLVGGCFEQ